MFLKIVNIDNKCILWLKRTVESVLLTRSPGGLKVANDILNLLRFI